MAKDEGKKPRRIRAMGGKEPLGKVVSQFFGTERPEFVTQEPVGVLLPRGYLSISQVGMYLRCPRQYMHRYVDGLVEPPGIALVEGILHHNVLQRHNRKIIKKGKGLSPKMITALFNDSVSAVKNAVADWGNDTEGGVRARGVELLKRYLEWETLHMIPRDIIAAEETFTLSMESKKLPSFGDISFNLVGVIDVHTSENVSDYKVVGRAKSANDAANDLQLSTYSLATRKRDVSFICFIKPRAEIREIPARFTRRQHQWAKTIICAVARAITTGVFPPCDPTHWMCSPRFCGYFSRCRNGK